MARGSNSNSDLYKKLHEEYGLEINVDFYLHPQSGSYIIKHNAVKKLVAKQREKGFIIETPMGDDIIIINDGTREGIHGKEVVVGGNFYLKNSDGVLIEKVYRTGEVNAKNCKNFYPHAMAGKRMYDRGVLDLLRFAQQGLYSDVEMDEFREKAPSKQNKPVEKKVAPPLPVQPNGIPVATAPKKPEEKVVNEVKVITKVLEMISQPSNIEKGCSKSEMWAAIGNEREEINVAIDELVERGSLYKTGQGRGVRYFLKTETNTETKTTNALTKDEYNVLWRDVSTGLRTKGFEYSQIMKIVNDVTGHDTAISAFKAGILTKEHIAQIENMGKELSA
jgi:hypothetical protein